MNNRDIAIKSPLLALFEKIDKFPVETKKLIHDMIAPILKNLPDENECEYETSDNNNTESRSELYSVSQYNTKIPLMEGMGLFPIINMVNHSCVPNVYVEYTDNTHAKLIALRNIAPNEELLISYIEEELSYNERRNLLLNYQFECDCSKCLIEKTTTINIDDNDKGKQKVQSDSMIY